MNERLTDEQIMKQLAQGDKKAAALLYDRYYKNVYCYFVRMTHDADASRDLTQNVFLKIIRYCESWKEDRVFVHWLFRIARNIMVDYYRGARKFYDLNDEPEITMRDQDDSVRTMETRESLDFLLDAMAQLPPGYRELIELNRFQGFSYKEIAVTISSNENAVKVKTFRAIKKLKEIYPDNNGVIMNCEDIKINLPEYIDRKLNEKTAKVISEHLESCNSCKELHEELSSFLGYLDTFPNPEIPEGMKDEFMELVKSQEKADPRKIRTIPMWLKAAAMIVVIFGTYWIGFQVGSGKSELKNNKLVSELSQQKQELILASLSDFTGPQKIEAVYSISSSGHVNDALINALVNTMNSDKNINVRLAAISALSGMMNKNERIKTDLIKSLAIQENPLLQISLIQILTESGVKEAKDEIESITNNEKTDESVKAFAKNMIKTII